MVQAVEREGLLIVFHSLIVNSICPDKVGFHVFHVESHKQFSLFNFLLFLLEKTQLSHL